MYARTRAKGGGGGGWGVIECTNSGWNRVRGNGGMFTPKNGTIRGEIGMSLIFDWVERANDEW